MEEPSYSLKQDGTYCVHTTDEGDTRGIFKGYSSLCGEIAVVIETKGEKLRFIPLAQIVYIDELLVPKSEDQPKKVDIYYR